MVDAGFTCSVQNFADFRLVSGCRLAPSGGLPVAWTLRCGCKQHSDTYAHPIGVVNTHRNGSFISDSPSGQQGAPPTSSVGPTLRALCLRPSTVAPCASLTSKSLFTNSNSILSNSQRPHVSLLVDSPWNVPVGPYNKDPAPAHEKQLAHGSVTAQPRSVCRAFLNIHLQPNCQGARSKLGAMHARSSCIYCLRRTMPSPWRCQPSFASCSSTTSAIHCHISVDARKYGTKTDVGSSKRWVWTRSSSELNHP